MFIFQVHHFIKPEKVELYRTATLENAQKTILEAGVIRFDVFQDTADPTHFSLLEIYQDKDAQARHLETEHFLAWKDVALEAFDRRGYGHEFEALFPQEEAWTK